MKPPAPPASPAPVEGAAPHPAADTGDEQRWTDATIADGRWWPVPRSMAHPLLDSHSHHSPTTIMINKESARKEIDGGRGTNAFGHQGGPAPPAGPSACVPFPASQDGIFGRLPWSVATAPRPAPEPSRARSPARPSAVWTESPEWPICHMRNIFARGWPKMSRGLADCFRLVVNRQRHLLELVSVFLAVM
jgi:hypothetical protein